jgi:hypothetical protein
MRIRARDLQPARCRDHQSVKPIAPVDLWEQIDKLVPNRSPMRPDNSFTVVEFAQRKGVSDSQACKLVRALYQATKLQKIKVGNQYYYTLT